MKKSNKKYRFYCPEHHSPTHHQLAKFMLAAGLRHTRWPWRAQFTEHHLNFAPILCEWLEFKHLLAQLIQQYCPTVAPETYIMNEFSWPSVLSDMAAIYYTSQDRLVDHVPDLAWILKPSLLNNGQYIKIFDTLSQMEAHLLRPDHLAGPHVLQRYITNPHLYDGRKYSMRFFVVISQEAGAFLYPDGYLNVALTPYTNDYQVLAAHLTNEHLHTHRPSVIQIPTQQVPEYTQWYPQIRSIVTTITRGLEEAFPQAYIVQKERTFAVFGFDFMLDQQGKVWFLEANHGPCFPIEEHHPLQTTLYQTFWESVVEQFVFPIANKRPIPTTGCSRFEALR
ncbi:MAG TPA: YheC/YheD family protein [Legionellaceae bacterium]|nr:YheC/YheD family protein [Legionellaceae bacterium]